MIRTIIHDPVFLAAPSEPAGKGDLPIVQDLLDTLQYHKDSCVGMAANMIGIRKKVIAVFDESSQSYLVMLNPKIVESAGAYATEEGCLSLQGTPRKCQRYRSIRVQYQDEKMKMRTKLFHGWTAQIIQHEIDHCNGVLI